MYPLYFILGVSGVGKSSLGKLFERELNYLHLEYDVEHEDGIDVLNLRRSWDAYWHHKDPYPLAREMQERIIKNSKAGGMLTFDSMVVLPPEYIELAELAGIRTKILYGPEDDCIAQYLRREKSTGTNRDESRWHRYNDLSSEKLNNPAYDKYLVPVFKDHVRISNSELIGLIL